MDKKELNYGSSKRVLNPSLTSKKSLLKSKYRRKVILELKAVGMMSEPYQSHRH